MLPTRLTAPRSTAGAPPSRGRSRPRPLSQPHTPTSCGPDNAHYRVSEVEHLPQMGNGDVFPVKTGVRRAWLFIAVVCSSWEPSGPPGASAAGGLAEGRPDPGLPARHPLGSRPAARPAFKVSVWPKGSTRPRRPSGEGLFGAATTAGGRRQAEPGSLDPRPGRCGGGGRASWGRESGLPAQLC